MPFRPHDRAPGTRLIHMLGGPRSSTRRLIEMDIGDAQREMRTRFAGGILRAARLRRAVACVGEPGDVEHAPRGHHDAGGGRILHFPDHGAAHPCCWREESAERGELPSPLGHASGVRLAFVDAPPSAGWSVSFELVLSGDDGPIGSALYSICLSLRDADVRSNGGLGCRWRDGHRHVLVKQFQCRCAASGRGSRPTEDAGRTRR